MQLSYKQNIKDKAKCLLLYFAKCKFTISEGFDDYFLKNYPDKLFTGLTSLQSTLTNKKKS
jgi:hypothetical protein